MEKKIDKEETAESRCNKCLEACKNIDKACMGLTGVESFGCLESVKMVLFKNTNGNNKDK